jgi:hypothetical protein
MTERDAGDKQQAGRGVREKYPPLERIEPQSDNM